jgi:hypothetical protein
MDVCAVALFFYTYGRLCCCAVVLYVWTFVLLRCCFILMDVFAVALLFYTYGRLCCCAVVLYVWTFRRRVLLLSSGGGVHGILPANSTKSRILLIVSSFKQCVTNRHVPFVPLADVCCVFGRTYSSCCAFCD